MENRDPSACQSLDGLAEKDGEPIHLLASANKRATAAHLLVGGGALSAADLDQQHVELARSVERLAVSCVERNARDVEEPAYLAGALARALGPVASSLKAEMTSLKVEMTSLKRETKEEFASLKADMTSVKEDILSLSEEVASVKEDISSLSEEVAPVKEDISSLTRLGARLEARDLNSRVLAGDTIVRVPNRDGELPPDPFPQTFADIVAMDGPRVSQLLRFYGECDLPCSVANRKHELCNVLGLRVDVVSFTN